jgi:short-subunit dehydrogenase
MTARTILITGASSGIGAALARVYAAPGNTLVLWGRDAQRLQATADECRTRGAAVETACFDITDMRQLTGRLATADAQHALDLAIFNAGLGGSLPRARAAQDPAAAEAMAGVNFTAPAVAANVVAEGMAKRGHGRIVLVGSVAGFYPLPMAPLYSGTKAGLAMFAEALRLRLARHGVGVSLVSPGFIDTPMSRGLTEPKPFLISADAAAAVIARKVERGAGHIVVPWQFAFILKVSDLVPRPLLRFVLSRFS